MGPMEAGAPGTVVPQNNLLGTLNNNGEKLTSLHNVFYKVNIEGNLFSNGEKLRKEKPCSR